MIEYYLGEAPILKNVETYDLSDRDQRDHVLANLSRMVVKPVDGSGGYGLTVGNRATDEQLAQVRLDIEADPRGWIAQPIVALSTAPTFVGDDGIEPRHVDLRPFAVNDGDEVWVLPGGLTRVALPRGSLVVNSSQGGGSKDTWVIDDGSHEEKAPDPPPVEPRSDTNPQQGTPGPPRRYNSPISHDDRILQQERQQQQASTGPGSPC